MSVRSAKLLIHRNKQYFHNKRRRKCGRFLFLIPTKWCWYKHISVHESTPGCRSIERAAGSLSITAICPKNTVTNLSINITAERGLHTSCSPNTTQPWDRIFIKRAPIKSDGRVPLTTTELYVMVLICQALSRLILTPTAFQHSIENNKQLASKWKKRESEATPGINCPS